MNRKVVDVIKINGGVAASVDVARVGHRMSMIYVNAYVKRTCKRWGKFVYDSLGDAIRSGYAWYKHGVNHLEESL